MADPTFCSINLYPIFLSLATVLLNAGPNKAQKYNNWFKKKFCLVRKTVHKKSDQTTKPSLNSHVQ